MNGGDGAPRADVTVDARGLRCPAPVIALARAARAHADAVVEVLADDPAARTDIPAWCQMRGARLLLEEEDGAATRYFVAVGEPGSAEDRG